MISIRTVSTFILAPALAGICAFAAVPAIAWLYDDVAVASFTLLQTSAILVTTAFSLQLDQAFAREFHEVPARGTLFAACVLPGLLIHALFFVSVAVHGLVTQEPSWAVGAALIGASSIHCTNLSLLSKRMEGDRLAYVINLIGPKIILLAAVLLGAIFHANIASVYLAASLASAVVSVYSSRMYWKDLSILALKTIRPLLKLSLPLVPATMLFAAIPVIDRYAVLWLSGEASVAAYSMASNVAGLASLGAAVFGAIWTPALYKWAAADKAEAMVREVSKLLPLGLAAGFLLIGCAAYVVPLILPPSYADIKYYIPAAAAYPLLFIASEVTGCGIGISRRTAYAFLPALLALAVGLSLHLVLTSSYGAPGAATASAVGYFIFFIARTELSNFVWRRFKNAKLYIVAVACVAWSAYVALWLPKSADVMIILGLTIIALVSLITTWSSVLHVVRLVSWYAK